MEQNTKNEITHKAAIKRWVKHLNAALFKGISEREVAKLIAPVARDDAWIYHGASGRRSRIYMVDNEIQARFDFDSRDLLISYSVYRSGKKWRKGPEGVLLNDPDASDAELLFP